MQIRKNQIIVLLITLLLTGCGMSNPSESDARLEFEKKWKKELQDGTIKITKFRKTDGQSGEFVGVKMYTLDYEAEIEYPNGLNPECVDRSEFSAACLGHQSMGQVRNIGEKQEFKDKILFEKTENGWRAVQRGF